MSPRRASSTINCWRAFAIEPSSSSRLNTCNQTSRAPKAAKPAKSPTAISATRLVEAKPFDIGYRCQETRNGAAGSFRFRSRLTRKRF